MPRHRHDIRGDINVIISCKANTFFWQIEQGYILNIYIGVLAILFNYHWFWRFCYFLFTNVVSCHEVSFDNPTYMYGNSFDNPQELDHSFSKVSFFLSHKQTHRNQDWNYPGNL